MIQEREAAGRELHDRLVDAGVVPFDSYEALPVDLKLSYERAAAAAVGCPSHDQCEHSDDCPYDESKLCGEDCADRIKDLDKAHDALADAERALAHERSAHADTTAMLDELLALGAS